MADQEARQDQDHEAVALPIDLGACVNGLMNAVLKGAGDELEGYDLTVIEFSLLRACMAEQEATATQLAEVLPVDASRVSRLVNQLVDKGLLVRRRLRNDRRIVMLRLSEEGVRLTSEILRHMWAYEAKLVEGIDEQDLHVFAEVALKMTANHDAMKA